jgi:hypothetical protein
VRDILTDITEALRRSYLKVFEAFMRIPEPLREALVLAAREQRSIDKYNAAHEAERQAGLAYVRKLGAQARRDLGLPEEGQ